MTFFFLIIVDDKIPIKIIKWEEILEHIKIKDNASYEMLNCFYKNCLHYRDAFSVDLSLLE